MSNRLAETDTDGQRRFIRLGRLGLALALIALATGAASGLGHRAGLWSFTTGFALLGVAALLGLSALILSLVVLVRALRRRPRQPVRVALLGSVLGALIVGLPAYQLRLGMTLPRIHDISTDTADPPAFVAILPLRAEAANPADYAGEAIARQQHAAYPEVAPRTYPRDASAVFDAASDVARAQGWTVVAAESGAGRIEAYERSRWFGFADDVVVRVRDTPQGTRVDVRSTSRVGLGDLGANARRIERFLARLDARLSR